MMGRAFGAGVLCAATLLLTGCGQSAGQKAQDEGKTAEAIKADVGAMVAAMNKREAEKAVEHDAPGFVGMMHGQANIEGREQDLAHTRAMLADPAFHLAVGAPTVDVSESGDMAVYRSGYILRLSKPGGGPGEVVIEKGNWVLGFRRSVANDWRVAWEVVSDMPLTGPTGEANDVPPVKIIGVPGVH